jgi:ADP-dependent NAD(P)H-hydrate dehydratase / NAD(P)H-hydrate epimerase
MLPRWLTALPSPSEQRALDAWAIDERGIPGIELMERAGTGMARIVADAAPPGTIVVVCGKGNNGGDGYVVARVLREQGRDVRVIALAPGDELTGDARLNFERLPGRPPEPFGPASFAESGIGTIVDAILGTGFSGVPREPAAAAIRAINRSADARVLACDIPSGVDGETGEIAGEAIHADVTVTFHAAKPGLWIAPGKACAGDVRVVDIGIPPHGRPVAPATGLIGPGVRDGIPRRDAESTKFAAGAVLVCGGSTGLTGAPTLTSLAAMRAGAGYVTACIPASLNAIFEIKLTEAMTVPLPDAGGALTIDGADVVVERCSRADALVLGPGLGRAEGSLAFARELAVRAPVPLVLDADGLNAFAGRLSELAERTAPTGLSPHAGELARLLGCASEDVQRHRLWAVRRAADEADAVVVLKGDDTLVATPDGRVAISRGGAPALATAGTGDVLSGVLGAFLAKRMDPWHAACAAVFVHLRAGQAAAARIGPEGVLAGDVVASVPGALTG